MISGALLLGKDEPFKSLWKKRILRFGVTLVLFSFVQEVWSLHQSGQLASFSFIGTLKRLLESPIRMQYWYLYSYISFLVMLPFLRPIARRIDDKLFIYLVIITIITHDVFPVLARSIGISGINFSVFLNSFTTLYPVLGYYLATHNGGILRNVKWPFLVLAILVCSLFAASMTIWNYSVTGNWEERYITSLYTITAICVFELIRKLIYGYQERFPEWICSMTIFISGTMFGIYLLENILEATTKPVFDWLRRMLPTWPACILWLIITMIFGNVVIGLMKRIPGIQKII